MAMLLEGVGEGGILTPPMKPVNHSDTTPMPQRTPAGGAAGSVWFPEIV